MDGRFRALLYHILTDFATKEVFRLEIKINKEIEDFKENVFFGLTMRQLICSGLALGIAAGVWFLLKEPLGEEAASWLCIVAALPVALLGFFHYNGMTAEQFVWAVVKSEVLCAGPRKFMAENYWFEVVRRRRKII